MKQLSRITIALLAIIITYNIYAAYPVNRQNTTKVATSPFSISSMKEVSKASTLTTHLSKNELKKQTSLNKKSGYGGKKKMAAIFLAFFLGWLGVHSFYMGQTTKGLIQLGGTALGIVLFITGVASSADDTIAATALIGYLLIVGVSIWALVDFIRILTGNLAPEEGFEG